VKTYASKGGVDPVVVSFPKKWRLRLPWYKLSPDVGVGVGVAVGVCAAAIPEETTRAIPDRMETVRANSLVQRMSTPWPTSDRRAECAPTEHNSDAFAEFASRILIALSNG
jgi:hypothetical protein